MLDHILALITEQGMSRRKVVELVMAILRGVGVRVTPGDWHEHGETGEILYLQEVEE